jgi:hypothetical protein
MKALILASALALTLAGCAKGPSWGQITAGVAAVENFKITQSQLDGARSAYVAGFLVPAAAYVKLPRCPAGATTSFSNQCSEQSKVDKIKTITAAMKQNFAAVKANMAAGGSGLSAAWTLLQSGLSTATALMAGA